jgi:hypothetical protein
LPPVVQSVIDALVAGIPGVRQAAGDARITTVFAPSELSAEVLEQADKEGVPHDEIHGVLYRGRAFIVCQNLKTVQDGEEVLAHQWQSWEMRPPNSGGRGLKLQVGTPSDLIE